MRDEEGAVAALLAEIRAALAGIDHEIVCIDDGSRDRTAERLRAALRPGLVFVRHAVSCGQSAAIRSGLLVARGRLVATLDGDGQNDPADLPRLIAEHDRRAVAGRPLLVMGHRTLRRDSLWRRFGSRLANGVRRALLDDGTADSGCGIKVLSRELFLVLPAFDHMHRFMPALVTREGGDVVSVPVGHRPRASGRSKYGNMGRLVVGLVDLFGVAWLMRRRRRAPVTVERAS